MNSHRQAWDEKIYLDRGATHFRVNHRVFLDPDVLEREREQIFQKCWLYLGHESELPDKNDFILRSVGGRELIFVRGQDETIRAFYNVCPHRGAALCREAKGNRKLFRCLYHAWAFDTQGGNVARPGSDRYPEGWLRPDLHNLRPVEQIDHYRGLYFVNFDASAVSLRSYLAGTVEYLDLIIDKSEVGMEIIGGSHQYGMYTNWKCLAENGFDGYHPVVVHQTYFDYLARAGDMDSAPIWQLSPQRHLGNGHGVMEYSGPWGRPVAKSTQSWGAIGEKEVAEIKARLIEKHGVEYATRLTETNFNMLVFPNLAVNDHMSTNIRTTDPVEVGKMVVNSWAIAPKEESPFMRKFRLKNFLEFLGPGGFATPDDAEALEQCQRGYRTLPDGWNDYSRGIGANDVDLTDELCLREYWNTWSERMAGGRA